MSIASDITSREYTKFKESSSISDQIGVVIVNPDGSSVGSLSSSSASDLLFTDAGANATANVKASSGVVKSVMCTNYNAAIRYLQLHNKATAASAGNVPLLPIPVYPGQTSVIDRPYFGDNGMTFSTGITFAFSTTEWTYTAGSAADQSTKISYL